VHLVWDWNGTLLDDLSLVVTATNASLATAGGPVVTADEHRKDFRRPVSAYYAYVLGRVVDEDEFVRLDRAFHDAYRVGLESCALTADALDALTRWPGTQSLLSMWFHDELVGTLHRYALTDRFARVDGLRTEIGGATKAAYLAAHLDELGISGHDTVLIGDSLDDADAAASVGAGIVLYTGGFTDAERLYATGLPVASSLVAAVDLAGTGLVPGAAGQLRR